MATAQPDLTGWAFFFFECDVYSTMSYNPQDRYYKKAKQEGYRSRAAYKLLELQQRFCLLRPGDRVVDLGAAPGGWLQVAAKIVGANGKVVGIDTQAIDKVRESNVFVIQGDIMSPDNHTRMKEFLGGPANGVLSDLAPKLTGIRDTDTARMLELNKTALSVATELLKPSGCLLIKSFVSDELQPFTTELKKYFSSVQRTRPEASRQGSSEFYFYAKGFTRPKL
jgi:23S rRNA (uridine2552-2'-O)-methyltransferase